LRRPADAQAALPQTGERLRRGHLMDEVQIDGQNGW
jgi:hypothetical protein